MSNVRKTKRLRPREIRDYDAHDTSAMIDSAEPLDLADLGLELPKPAPTQVVSIRLPSALLNQIKAFASARDVPYQALIKHSWPNRSNAGGAALLDPRPE